MSRGLGKCARILLAATMFTPVAAHPRQTPSEPQHASPRGPIRVYIGGTPTQPVDDRMRQRTSRDALRRLPGLIRNIGRIEDAPARVRVRAHLAAALWDRDAATAKALIRKAFEDAGLCPDVPARIGLVAPGRDELREEVVRIAGQHDPALAARLVESVKRPADAASDSRMRASYESRRSIALVETAFNLIRVDPARAAQAARESLRGGITANLPEVIGYIGAADPKLGGDLLDAAIDRIGAENVFPLEIYDLGVYLVRDALDPKRVGEMSTEPPHADPTVARRFLEAAAAATDRFVTQLERSGETPPKTPAPFDAVSFGGDTPSVEEIAGSFFVAMTDLLPAYERYDSAAVVRVRALVDRLGRFMDPVERDHMYAYYDNGDTPESLAAEAEASTNQKSRAELFEIAVNLALGKRDYDAARSVIDRMDEPSLRERFLTDLLTGRIFEAAQANRFDEARALLGQLPSGDARASIAGHVLVQALQRGARIEVAGLERETVAFLSVGRGVSPALAAEILMSLARLHASSDSARAFALAASAVEAANRAAGRPVDVEAYKRTGRQPPFDTLTWVGARLGVFESLAHTDYIRALRLARSLVDPALALEAQLAVVRSALPPH